MHSQENKNRVWERMKQAMESDRTKHSILPLSKFGLMQITRQRVRPEMEINTREKCPTCGGTGEISPSILIVEKIDLLLAELLNKYKVKRLTLRLHPFIASYIEKGWLLSVHHKWMRRYHCKIRIVPISSFDFLEFHFFNTEGKELSH
jgi:ribonuclease G